MLLWDPKKLENHSPEKTCLNTFIEDFKSQNGCMPLEPKMGLGEEVEMSGQRIVVAVTFGCAF